MFSWVSLKEHQQFGGVSNWKFCKWSDRYAVQYFLILVDTNYRWNEIYWIINKLAGELFSDEATNNRSSCPELFCKKGVLRNFAKFIGKHLCQSFFFNKVAGFSNNLIYFGTMWNAQEIFSIFSQKVQVRVWDVLCRSANTHNKVLSKLT